jgi:hypothetical protein
MSFNERCSLKSIRILTINSTFVPAINVYERNGRALTSQQKFTCDMYTAYFPELKKKTMQVTVHWYLFTATALLLMTFSRQKEAFSKWRRPVM